MQCVICHRDIQAGAETWVSTSDALVVHVVCADREASCAWAQRQRQALYHAAILAGLLADFYFMSGTKTWILVTGVIGGLLHLYLHQYWWHSNVLAFRRYCQRIGRQPRPWCE